MRGPLKSAIPLSILLAAFGVFVACTNEPQNTNSVSSSESEVSKAPKDPPFPDICALHPNDRKNRLQTYLDSYTMQDTNLNGQRGHKFNFNVEEYTVNNDPQKVRILVRIKGKVLEGQNGPPKLSKLIKFFEHQMKRGCVERVSFEPGPLTATTNANAAALSAIGFEWQACEHPEFVCSNTGTCSVGGSCMKRRPGDPSETPTPTPTPTPSPTVTPTPSPVKN